ANSPRAAHWQRRRPDRLERRPASTRLWRNRADGPRSQRSWLNPSVQRSKQTSVTNLNVKVESFQGCQSQGIASGREIVQPVRIGPVRALLARMVPNLSCLAVGGQVNRHGIGIEGEVCLAWW